MRSRPLVFPAPRLVAKAVAGLLLALSMLVPDAEARRIISPEFDSRQQLRFGGNDVSVTGPLTCTAGDAWRIDVVVTQGDKTGRARTAGNCSGTGQEWRARVAVEGDDLFEPGSARGCGELVATNTDGDVTRKRNWCSDFTLVSDTSGVEADADDEEDSDALTVVALILGGLALLLASLTLLAVRRRT